MANDFPVCRNPLRDCKALDPYGRCIALVDVDFGKRTCPFYKGRRNRKEDRDVLQQRQ